jgi:OTT_1508-like deaminase
MIGKLKIRQLIQKLISPQKYLNVLFNSAHSPRNRPAFVYDMHIRPVPSHHTVHISLPNSASEWEPLIKTICKSQEIEPRNEEWYLNEGEAVYQAFGGGEKKGKVHCECNLIAFLEENPNGRGPPIDYVGVSKPNCAPCYLWIQQYNKFFGRNYQTRGTNSKWHKYWVMPTLSDAQQQSRIGKAFIEEIVNEYCKEQETRGSLRSIYDASVVSEEVEDSIQILMESDPDFKAIYDKYR